MTLSGKYRNPALVWLLTIALCSTGAGFAGQARGDQQVWVLVDTNQLSLNIMRGNRTELVLPDIAIGRYGTTWTKRRGDNRTPLGEFRIAWINSKSRFHRFIGLDYPNLDHARRAYEEGRITSNQWRAIQHAQGEHGVPPQNTPLGGQIGLHGIGQGDIQTHLDFNWTHGCIAVTNQQIDQLLQHVGLGTRVVIR